MKIIQITTEVDLTDLMGQVFRDVDYSVMLDLLLDGIEAEHSFPRECNKLIEQITKRVERQTYVADCPDAEEEEEE